MPLVDPSALPEVAAALSVPLLIVVATVYVFAPEKVYVPPPVSVRPEIALVFEMTPLMARVPPDDWVNVWVVPAAAPRMTAALTVFVPLVFVALIALLEPVPVLVRVTEFDPLIV